MLTPAQQVDEISVLGISFDKKNKRHFAPSRIKILYHLYNMGKTNAQVFPEAETIAKEAGCSGETVSRFVNSEEFKKYGFKVWRCFTSNEYRLHPWVIECFKSLEKLGFMRHFRADFNRWRKLWTFRMPKFYCSKLLNISTWSQVFNIQIRRTKLSTKYFDGCGIEKGHGCGTTRSSSSYKELRKKKTVFSPPPFIKDLEQAVTELSTCFSIQDGDLNMIMNNYCLRDIKGGIIIRRSWKGFTPSSPIAAYISCVNRYKKGKMNAN